MCLTDQVLLGVSDKRLLTDHQKGATPLQGLMQAYTLKAARNDNAPNLTDLSTGLDLKSGLQKLEPEDQVELMYGYLVSANRLLSTVAEDQRKLRNWVVKIFVGVFAAGTLLTFGAVTSIAVRTGAAPSNDLVGGFLDMAGDIAHVIFTSSKE